MRSVANGSTAPTKGLDVLIHGLAVQTDGFFNILSCKWYSPRLVCCTQLEYISEEMIAEEPGDIILRIDVEILFRTGILVY